LNLYLSGQPIVKCHTKVFVGFPPIDGEGCFFAKLIRELIDDRSHNIWINVGDLQIVNVPKDGALHAIDDLIDNTGVIGICHKTPAFEFGRKMLPKQESCLECTVKSLL
jgi:hypothetical protein